MCCVYTDGVSDDASFAASEGSVRGLSTFSSPCPRARAAFATLILTLDKGSRALALFSMASDTRCTGPHFQESAHAAFFAFSLFPVHHQSALLSRFRQSASLATSTRPLCLSSFFYQAHSRNVRCFCETGNHGRSLVHSFGLCCLRQ
jgi:hypothetical protein